MLTGWGRSPLSNEVVAALGFLFLAGMYWLASFSTRVPFLLAKVWLGLSCIAALWLVAMISVVYAIPTIPTWDNPLVPLALWLLALSTGPVLGLASLLFSRVEVLPSYRRVLLAASACGYGAMVAVSLMQNARLAQLHSPYSTSFEVAPWYPLCLLAFGLLGAASLVLGALSLRSLQSLRRARLEKVDKTAGRPARANWWPVLLGAISAVLMLGAAAFMRVAFYAAYLTVGL